MFFTNFNNSNNSNNNSKALTNLLLLILVILLIYCIMYHLIYDTKRKGTENIDKSINNINIKNTKSLKEKFEITEEELNKYYSNLLSLENSLNNINVPEDTKKLNEYKTEYKNKISNLLKTLYGIEYIDYVNKNNAMAYKEYVKYKTPETNLLYQSFASA
jgi:hypothetical protein